MTRKTYTYSDDLERYLEEIRRFPMLSIEEEVDLARRWRDNQDREAMTQLIGSHLRLVTKIARRHAGYGLPLNDLVSVGHLGLMHAVAKFDPDRGVRFSTYATWWIRAGIQEHILHSWSLVKMGTTAAQKKLFFNLRRLKSRLQAFGEGDLALETAESIASELDVPVRDVAEMNSRLAARDQSLNAVIDAESQDEWQDLLIEEAPDQEALVMVQDELAWRRNLLEQGLIKLSERDRDILTQRKLTENPPTLEALSREYGISRERVRQIENRAYDKLRNAMLQAAHRNRTRIGETGCGK